MFKKKRKPHKYIIWERPSPTYTRKSVRRKFLQRKNRSTTIPSKPQKIRQRQNSRIKQMATIAIVATLIGFVFFSNAFHIKSFKFQNNNFEAQAINLKIESILNEYKDDHILFFNTDLAISNIHDKIPSIETIRIHKKLPGNLSIEYQEFPLVANIKSESPQGKKSYIINSTGYAIKENVEHKELPTITLITAEPPNIDIPLISQEQTTYLLEAKQNFENKFGMKIIETHYLKTAREVHLITEKDFTVWIDIQQPHENQYRKLKKALIKLDIYNTPLEYIDLRIAGENGDKIIYKPKL